ncbi:MAG: exopolysaccharide Pel transporter PelG [Alkalispirochaeta sp.]
MAGIGFVLERIVERRGIRGLARVAVVGVLVVAGPWLITSVTLGVVGALAASRGMDLSLFFAVIIYVFAGSLIITSGYHYRVTRITADLLYQKRYRVMLQRFGRAATVSAGIGAVLGVGIALLGSLPATVAAATTAVAIAVSVSWVAMLMVSLLTRFRAIVGAYAAGGLVTVGGAVVLAPQAYTPEAVAVVSLVSFAAGTVVVTVILSVTVARTLTARDNLRRTAGALRPAGERASTQESPRDSRADSRTDSRADSRTDSRTDSPRDQASARPVTVRELARERGAAPRGSEGVVTLPVQTLRRIGRIGVSLTLILWVDKLIFWVAYGLPVAGTTLRLLPTYDILVFVSQLFLVPAMVFFVVRVETTTYRGVRTILRAVRGETYREVERAKQDLFHRLNRLFTTQAGLALTIVVVAWVLSPDVAPRNPAVFVRVTIAAQLYFLMYSSVVTLLYISDYRGALTVAALVLAVAVVGSIITVTVGTVDHVGYSYLAAGAIGAIIARSVRNSRLVVVDRYLLTRALM